MIEDKNETDAREIGFGNVSGLIWFKTSLVLAVLNIQGLLQTHSSICSTMESL
jgi:hypothetical protein